ncbi:hypothetical protein BCR32DRAFT_199281 [Anaeromyces robustus]|uniref:alpha-galactosidase n=1 Tax=Anaeromyces robustus TaxID=1754192 RepID=A0A1Y1XKB5_9FUNG|nr:hypothetical protein BCR32DRAFT_199281 [Anaeromyces robustus]|eukprot:ORX86133.1 hypothetical protein BCR32DRAFT_199281 [Anaeromyces robustus]
MKFLLSAILYTSLFIVNNVEARWQPGVGTTWNYVLQGGSHINVSKEPAQAIDLDINNDAKINELRKAGKRVICYFSGGTIETNREDYDEYFKVDGLVRNRYEDWPKERWLDFRKEGIKPLIKNRMKKAVSKNCDAIEVDNLGAYLHDEVKSWSDPITKEDTIVFAKWLGNTAHSLGISIGLKNVLGIIDSIGDYFDFAINESCILYNECHLYKNFLNQGKAVFAVTYGGVSSHQDALCRNLDGLGISMIVKDGDDLIQDGTVFDGKKYCGSSFKGTLKKI